MAALTDNVIRFPDGSRGPIGNFDRSRTYSDARDLMAHKLREAFRALLPAIEENFLERGDVADERDQRQLYYGARDSLHDNASRLEGLLAAKWIGLMDQRSRGSDKTAKSAVSLDAEELTLVEFGTMDHDLAVKAIANRLRNGCEEGLFAAGRRLAFLLGLGEEDLIPIEDLIAQSLDTALGDAGFEDAVRLEVLRTLEHHVVEAFATPLHDLNSFLVGRNILPRLRRHYARAKTEKPEAESEGNAADVFALLQKLVAVQPSGGTQAGTGGGMAGGGSGGVFPAGAPAGMVGGQATGSGGGVGVPADMAMAMEQIMVSLDALQRTVPAQMAAAPLTNVLRDFRTSDTGQNLGYLDAVTVDIVATLFDFIFDDASVADPIKAVVARLQIPLLKVAMLDKTFFSSKAHPARKLLDGISRAAVRCGPQASHGDPLYARIASIVDRLQNEFVQDTSLFDTLCAELEEFLESQEVEADARAARAAPLVAEQETREMAILAADEALAGWLAMPLPSVVSDLLAHEWRTLLIRHYVDGNDTAWGAALTAVSDLVASVEPQPDAAGRKQLATRLPTLVRRIHEGLDSLKVADDRRLALIDALFSLHAAVLRGSAPVVTDAWPSKPAAEVAPPVIESEHIESGETQLDRISLAGGGVLPESSDSDDAQQQVADLQRGDWVEFVDGEGVAIRYRLSWISPQRGILLFTNPQSPRAISVAPDALALQIQQGEAAVVPVEPMFDRAVTRALETLQAA